MLKLKRNIKIKMRNSGKVHFHADTMAPINRYNRNLRSLSWVDPNAKGAKCCGYQFQDIFLPHDNKLGIKLYGNRKAIMKERMRQRSAGHCVIHPCSIFR